MPRSGPIRAPARYFRRLGKERGGTWLRFLRNFGPMGLFGYGYWGVEDKESGRYIGAVGFFQARRPCDIPYRDQPETGWVIAPDFHGRGLAREACRRHGLGRRALKRRKAGA